MAEALSPNPKQRGPFSPSSPFFLGSNDDKLERAQARAARAAAIRRKPAAAGPPAVATANESFLDKQQILELFHNCIKLASENKINQKNTWELNLIDHLCEIIKVEEENDAETNFQKASCTLEAGVKIYSMRVDSVHSEAYKVLGGINRVGQENEKDNTLEDVIDSSHEEGHSKKDQERKLSPLSTLESSFEALNVKKFDVAFAVDPLYHQTSAQFDEGGAKGLLLNNLGVYGNCQVLFDSLELPGKCTLPAIERGRSETIDITFMRDTIEQMVFNIPEKEEISPTLKDIVNLFDEDNRRPPCEPCSSVEKSPGQVKGAEDCFEFDNGACENCGGLDQDEETSLVDEGTYDGGQILPSLHGDGEPCVFSECDVDDRFEKVDDYLFLSLGLLSRQNAWAGPDHWKYRKAKEIPENEDDASPVKAKKSKSRKIESDIDFTKALDADMSNVFAPPKNPKSLLLPANRAPCNTRLPEDCHYQPEDLVKLFLLPNVMCLGRRRRKVPDESSPQEDDYGAMPSWDDQNGFDCFSDHESAYGNVEDLSNLVSQPRQVNKIEVQYDKTSKQVDVQALKETLWDHIREKNLAEVQENSEDHKISFKQILATFPSDCRAASSVRDISPHLCFICLLHLANEHGLWIHGSANLDDLSIHL
ncbi:condensin complex subunit 2-like [Coffea arabica]|uniref:Condensin complex subunit 2 n=1 Tax=Coffea arabica TaxID=13443 RepID=A0A6P6SG85_COFAR|nr:condensin complex subunit 2-like isoform X1 [Coffea arabica]